VEKAKADLIHREKDLADRQKSSKARTQRGMLSPLEEHGVDKEEVGHNYLAEDIARSLKNNWDIKKAIVINEILTRKYN